MKYCAAAVAMTSTFLLSACGGSGTSGGQITSGPTAAPLTVSVDLADTLDGESGAVQAPALAAAEAPAANDSFVDGANDVNFASILNNLRLSRGLGTVSYDARLDAAAEKYAIEQVSLGPASLGADSLSHVGKNGSTVYDRIVAEGYNPVGWAENLAKGQQSQAAVLEGWINSEGHNANLNANLEDFALGVAGSGSSLSWVLILATEQ